jgi:hypothetical protein
VSICVKIKCVFIIGKDDANDVKAWAIGDPMILDQEERKGMIVKFDS